MKRNLAGFLLTAVLSAAVWAQSDARLDLANATIADLNAAFNKGTLTA